MSTIQKIERSVVVASVEDARQFLERAREAAPRSGFGVRGFSESMLFRRNGDIEVRSKENGISDAGFSFIAHSIGNRAAAGATAAMGWIEVGTGTTAFAAAQTALVTALNRQAATFAHTVGTKVFSFSASYAAGVATGAITEAGVFNASSAGTMLDRVTFSVINKGSDDSLTQTFTFTMS
jgi:hypothetical protein